MSQQSALGMNNYQVEEPVLRDEIRSDLLQAFEKAFSGNNPAMSKNEYMTLFTRIYNHYKNTPAESKSQIGGQMYELIEEHLVLHVKQISRSFQGCTDATILTLYQEQWTKFKSSSKLLRGICSFLDKHHWDASFPLYTLALLKWKGHIFCHLQKQVTENILKQIELERQGEKIDTGLVRDIINSYVEIGNEKRKDPFNTSQIEDLSVYRVFENAFLEETERFYAQKTRENDNKYVLLQPNQVAAELMDRIEQIVAEEHNRVERYLDETTVWTLRVTCERVFVEKHLDVFVNAFKHLMLTNDSNKHDEELGRIYRLVYRNSSKGLSKLREIFEEHITQLVLSVINAREEEAAANNDPKVIYVTTTLAAVRNKYRVLIASTFNEDAGLLASLEDSFIIKIVNSTLCDSGEANKSLSVFPEALL